MPDCYFCGEEEIIITTLHHENTENITAPICHRCFNRAAVCRDPIVFNGVELVIDYPIPVYGVDYIVRR